MNIIELAREAGWVIRDDLHYMDHQAMQDALIERIERFAALVRADALEEFISTVIDLGYISQSYADEFTVAIREKV